MGLDRELRDKLRGRDTRGKENNLQTSTKIDAPGDSVSELLELIQSVQSTGLPPDLEIPSVAQTSWWEPVVSAITSQIEEIRKRCASMNEADSSATYQKTLCDVQEALAAVLSGKPSSMTALAEVNTVSEEAYIQSMVQVEQIPLEIDDTATQLINGTVKLVLKTIPPYATKIFYSAGTPTGTGALSGGGDIESVSAAQYKRDGLICIKTEAGTDTMVSVFCQYGFPNGDKPVSEPVTILLSDKPKQRISYQIEWQTGREWFTKKSRTTAARLVIRTDAYVVPELVLLCRKDGYIPSGKDELGVIVLGTYGGISIEDDRKTVSFELPVAQWQTIAPRTALKLVFADDDLTGYELVCEDISSMQTR